MKKAIVTNYNTYENKVLSEITHSKINEYAQNIGAEFIAINDVFYNNIKNLLEIYDRIAWIGPEILVNPLSPSIFDVVPENSIGILNLQARADYSDYINYWNSLTKLNIESHLFMSISVIVASKMHKNIFDLSGLLPNNTITACASLTHSIAKSGHKVAYLSDEWNHIYQQFSPYKNPYNSNFVNFLDLSEKYNLSEKLENFLLRWEKIGFKKPGMEYVIFTGGGMGNQVATIPVIEEFINNNKKSMILIISSYAEVFEHLQSERVKVINSSKVHKDEINNMLSNEYEFAHKLDTMNTNNILQMTYMNSTDYHSLTLLGRQLENRRIIVPVKDCGIQLPSNTIVLHPGRNAWKSKDIPKEMYQEIADKLKSLGYKIAIIGRRDFVEHGEGYGAYELDNIDYNFLDRSFAETNDVIRQAKLLLSNDSMPVHAAGSFDNWIALITIAKHPDLIFPYRPAELCLKNLAFTAPKGHNFWELCKRDLILDSGEKYETCDQMLDGMQWPTVDEIVTKIHDVLKEEV